MLGPEACRDYWGGRVPSRFDVQSGEVGSEEYCDQMQRERTAQQRTMET